MPYTVIVFSLLIISLISFVIVWLYLILILNEPSIPSLRISDFKNVLITFPHPDDEVLGVGGFINKLVKNNTNVTLLVFTHGENGQGGSSDELRKLRSKELENSVKLLGIKTLIHKDLGDGHLKSKKQQMREYLLAILNTTNFDAVVTYDQSGFYGHPDHIALSEVVTDLKREKKLSSKLIYVTFPKRFYKFLKLPEHMANDPEFRNRRTYPTHKVFIIPNMLNKVLAFYAHRSQLKSFEKHFPKVFPFWYFISVFVYEYFYIVED